MSIHLLEYLSLVPWSLHGPLSPNVEEVGPANVGVVFIAPLMAKHAILCSMQLLSYIAVFSFFTLFCSTTLLAYTVAALVLCPLGKGWGGNIFWYV